MNRVEFIQQLEQLLRDIPENDRLDAISYYKDYFDEAGVENEQNVIRELGSPAKVAATIKADLNIAEEDTKIQTKRNIPWPLIIILLVLSSPIWLGTVGGILGGVLGVVAGLLATIVALFACCIAFIVAGAACIIVGIMRVGTGLIEGLVIIGVGSILLALGVILLVLFIWCVGKWLPTFCKWCTDGIQKLWKRWKKEV